MWSWLSWKYGMQVNIKVEGILQKNRKNESAFHLTPQLKTETAVSTNWLKLLQKLVTEKMELENPK